MRKSFSFTFVIFSSFVIIVSCKKAIQKEAGANEIVSGNSSSGTAQDPSCFEILEHEEYQDTLPTPTILGKQLNGNPYAVSVMQQASINLYGTSNGIVANKKYVRFKPADKSQLKILSEADIDLFDYPLDREVIEEGDYYPQDGIGDEEIPWLYTVVDYSYQPPSGIRYEVLSELYIPDQDLWLEDEAFRITGNSVEDTCSNTTYRLPTPCSVDPCGIGCTPPS